MFSQGIRKKEDTVLRPTLSQCLCLWVTVSKTLPCSAWAGHMAHHAHLPLRVSVPTKERLLAHLDDGPLEVASKDLKFFKNSQEVFLTPQITS